MESPVTIFRSADESAEQDATQIQQLLAEQGITAELADDDTPGVPSGAWEVRVSAADQARAEELVARYSDAEESEEVDPSANLDLVTVFRPGGLASEAVEVTALLEAGGISAILVGDARFPNLGQEVRVPRDQETAAKRLIADALAAGPAAADEAEASTEKSE
jgi:hypothetical protein